MLDAEAMISYHNKTTQKQKDIDLMNTTIATLIKAREYARDFHRLQAVKHLDTLLKDLEEFRNRLQGD